jgi:hypothetical protein
MTGPRSCGFDRAPTWRTNASTAFGAPHAVTWKSIMKSIEFSSSGVAPVSGNTNV